MSFPAMSRASPAPGVHRRHQRWGVLVAPRAVLCTGQRRHPYALQRGRGRQPVPVGTALLGMVVAVAAVCATAVLGASLTRLISSPALYGVPFQAEFSNEETGSGADITGPVLASLRKDPAIERITVAGQCRLAGVRDELRGGAPHGSERAADSGTRLRGARRRQRSRLFPALLAGRSRPAQLLRAK
jgi:hypothetical protein